MMRTMAGPLTVISLFWYGSAHWQVTPSLSLISFTNSHVLYFFISFIFSLFLRSNAANILMILILIPWYLFSVHILFRLNSDLVNRGLDYAARERIISFTNGYTAVTAGVIYASEIVAESADIYATVYINDINLWSFNGYLIHKRIPVPPLPLTAGDTIKIIITGTASSNGGYFIPYK